MPRSARHTASRSRHNKHDLRGCSLRRPQDVGLPVAQDDPPQVFEFVVVAAVTFRVGNNLGYPVGRVVPSGEALQPLVQVSTVPKVAIAKDSDMLLGENDIGTPRQVRASDPVTRALPPQGAAQRQLTRGPDLAARPSRSGTCSRRSRPESHKGRRSVLAHEEDLPSYCYPGKGERGRRVPAYRSSWIAKSRRRSSPALRSGLAFGIQCR